MSDTYYDGAYTGEEIDAAVAAAMAAAPQSTTYTKTEVDTLLSAKAPQSTTYTKSEVDAALAAIKDGTTIDSFADVETALEKKIDHDIPALTGSILDYAVSLPSGIYFARHGASDGSDKPEAGKRYMYQIMKYAAATMTLIAYEGQGTNSNSIYMKNYTSSSWGPWVKFTGTIVT